MKILKKSKMSPERACNFHSCTHDVHVKENSQLNANYKCTAYY